MLTVWLGLTSYWLHHDLPNIRKRLAQVESHAPAHDAVPAPSREKLAALRQRVAVINGLAGGDGVPLTTLLAQLETLLPDSAYIVSLHYKRRQGEARLVAEAAQSETLTAFLQNLEKSGHFSEVLLTHQSQRITNGAKHTQFELRLRQKL
jgi:Tfp pilus assembly protein PilN